MTILQGVILKMKIGLSLPIANHARRHEEIGLHKFFEYSFEHSDEIGL